LQQLWTALQVISTPVKKQIPKPALNITENKGSTKIQILLNALTGAMANGTYSSGDALPSVNALSRQSGYSKDTVVKAYRILQERSQVESVPAKGFFVAGKSQRIFMLLDDFSAFKEQLYQAFRANIPGTWTVDLLFHHYNERVFEQLVMNAAGRYSMYVIMNISNREIHPVLKKLNPSRLLVLDMGTAQRPEISYLLQNFDKAVTLCLEESLPLLRKYHEIIMIYSHQKTPHPTETVDAVSHFCKQNGFGFTLLPEFDINLFKKGQMYLVIKENDLVDVVRASRDKKFKPGSEIGILAYNDTPMKEIAGNGISTISVDFTEMGKKAADFVVSKQRIQEILPTSLIIRNSL
jgi:DNA-binding transcriptional regulator YhcF (GntR family)